MTLCGFERRGTEDVPGATWIIPASLTSSVLDVTRESIIKHQVDPPNIIDGHDPREQLRRKPTAESRDTYQSALDVDFGSGSEGEDNVLFPANIRSKSSALNELKQKRRKRRNADDEEKEGPDDETLEERRRARQANALARQQKIKSDLYVNASDEESNEEADVDFFAREEQRRKEQARRVHDALVTGVHPDEQIQRTKPKRKNEDTVGDYGSSGRKRQRNSVSLISQDTDDDEDSPMIGLGSSPVANQTPPTSTNDDLEFDELDSIPKSMSVGGNVNSKDKTTGISEDEDDAPIKAPVQRRRGGFVIDSDSE